jgi:hypothetical protein
MEYFLLKNDLVFLEQKYNENYDYFCFYKDEVYQLQQHVNKLQMQLDKYSLDSTNLLNSLNYSRKNFLVDQIYLEPQYLTANQLRLETELSLKCTINQLESKTNEYYYLENKLYFIDHKYNFSNCLNEIVKYYDKNISVIKNIINDIIIKIEKEDIIKNTISNIIDEIEKKDTYDFIKNIIHNDIFDNFYSSVKEKKRKTKKQKRILLKCNKIIDSIISKVVDNCEKTVLSKEIDNSTIKIKKCKNKENIPKINEKNIITKKRKKKRKKKNKIPKKDDDLDYLDKQIELRNEKNLDTKLHRILKMEQLMFEWVNINKKTVNYDKVKKEAVIYLKIPTEYWKCFKMNNKKFDPIIKFNDKNRKFEIIPKKIDNLNHIKIVLGDCENDKSYEPPELSIVIPDCIELDQKKHEFEVPKNIFGKNSRFLRIKLIYPLIDKKVDVNKTIDSFLNFTSKNKITNSLKNELNEIKKIIEQIKEKKFYNDDFIKNRLTDQFSKVCDFFISKIKLLEDNANFGNSEEEIKKNIKFNEIEIFKRSCNTVLSRIEYIYSDIAVLKKLSELLSQKIELFILINDSKYNIKKFLDEIKNKINLLIKNPFKNFKQNISFLNDFINNTKLISKIDPKDQLAIITGMEIEVFINTILNQICGLITKHNFSISNKIVMSENILEIDKKDLNQDYYEKYLRGLSELIRDNTMAYKINYDKKKLIN